MLTNKADGLADMHGYYPMLATIVTAKSKGKENAMAVAWHAMISATPPAYGVSISRKRFTHSLIKKSGKFAVNFIPASEAELVAAVGGCSGRDVDKFKEFRIDKVDSSVLDVPVLKCSYFAIECEVTSRLPCGDHDWLVGRIAATHWSKGAFDSKGLMRLQSATPTVYMGRDHYLMLRGGKMKHLDRKECASRRRRATSRKARRT